MAKTLYPELEWDKFTFMTKPRRFWMQEGILKEYAQFFERKNGLNSPEDWYNVRKIDLKHQMGQSAILQFDSVYAFVKHVYPEYPWKEELFSSKSPRLIGLQPYGHWSNYLIPFSDQMQQEIAKGILNQDPSSCKDPL